MINYFHLFFLTIILFVVSCGKKDVAKNVTVSGNVRNNCTGVGFAGVKVKFTTSHEKSFGKIETSTLTAITDNSGNFSFSNLEINNNSNYKYFMSIDSYSNYDYEFFGISPQELDKGKISNPYQIGVSASFKILNFHLLNGLVINPPDTFSARFFQRTLHKFESSRIWYFDIASGDGLSYLNNSANYIGNYPMGWWHITLDKTKSGVNSTIYDSIYVDMGGTATYTIPW
jgi:hypothetical protein